MSMPMVALRERASVRKPRKPRSILFSRVGTFPSALVQPAPGAALWRPPPNGPSEPTDRTFEEYCAAVLQTRVRAMEL